MLTGAGSAFCAGMDVTQFGGDQAHKQRLVESSLAAFGTVARFPKPLVAAVNGPAIAGGFVLALHCDVRLASETARFGFPELPRGIPPSYAAALSGLPEPVARELCLTGRMMEAPEALHYALVAEVVPDTALVERSLAVAQRDRQAAARGAARGQAAHPARGRPRPRAPVRRRGARLPGRPPGRRRSR